MRSLQLILILALIALLKVTTAHAENATFADAGLDPNTVPVASVSPSPTASPGVGPSPSASPATTSIVPSTAVVLARQELMKKYFWIGKCVGEIVSQPGAPIHSDSTWKLFYTSAIQSCKGQWHPRKPAH